MLMTNYAQQLFDLDRLAEAQDYAERALESAKRAGTKSSSIRPCCDWRASTARSMTLFAHSRSWTKSNRG